MAIDWDKMVLGPVHARFGDTGQYRPQSGAPFQIEGIFDEAYRETDLAGGMALTTEMPVLGVRLALFATIPLQGDQFTLDKTGVAYVVKEVRPDGHGEAKLMLNEAP